MATMQNASHLGVRPSTVQAVNPIQQQMVQPQQQQFHPQYPNQQQTTYQPNLFQQPMQPQYQPQYRKQPPQSISDVYSDEEAISQKEKMDDLLSKINGDGAIYNSKDAGTIEQLIAAMNYVAGFIVNVDDWIPKGKEKYAPSIRDNATKISTVLRKFSDQISKLA